MNKRIIAFAAALAALVSCSSDRNSVLKVYNWSDYIDESVIPEFEQWYKEHTGEDITVIYLGTNDFSRNMQPSKRHFTRNYIKLLNEIKEYYGETHPILCIAPKHDRVMHEYINDAIQASGLENVHFVGLSAALHNDKEDMGADGHPNYSGHTKLAYGVIPYISTITGWEMSGNEVK